MAVWTEDTQTRGEVRVETGAGYITAVAHEAGKRNAQITIKATHYELRDPVTGWVDTADSAVWPFAQEAHDGKLEVDYRIEVHRKAKVDRAKPLAELGTRDKVRDVAVLCPKGQMPAGEHQPPAGATTTDEPPTQEPTAAAPTSSAHQPQRQASRGPRIEEGRPWELYNSDGSLNLGSYSYQAVVDLVELAHHLFTKRIEEAAAGPADVPEFRMLKIAGLARVLLDAADQVQAATRKDGRVDRMDNSHRRARSAIRRALYIHPVPWDAEPDVRDAWLEQLTAHATELLGVSLELFKFHETGDPR